MRHPAKNHGPDKVDYITFAEAAEVVPGQPHEMTVRRWWRHGLKGNGRQIHLQTVKVAGRRFTTRRWLEEFLNQVAEAMRN